MSVSEVWHGHFRFLKFRSVSQHAVCNECLRHKLLLRQLGGFLGARHAQQSLYAGHLLSQYRDRVVYWSNRGASRSRSGSLITLICDSMDHSSTTDEPAPSVASEDHNMLVQAYGMTQNHFTVTRHALVGGSATLNIMDIYPMQWPLAKIKIPIDYLIQRVERLLTGFANEISATQWYPATFDRRIKSSAKFLTERIAIYLAKEVASILRPVVSHPLLTQFDPDSKPLLTSDFWVMPIYKELLCQAEAGDEPEEPVDNSKGPRVGTKQYLNAVSPIQYMNVWFPAHWAPVVMEVLETKNEDFRKKYPRWFPESGSARASGSYGQSRENRELSFCKGRMDRDESLPTLTGRLKADWIHLPVDDVLALFPL